MRMKNLNRIRELCEWQRQSFEKNFPTGKKLSEAILKVFEDVFTFKYSYEKAYQLLQNLRFLFLPCRLLHHLQKKPLRTQRLPLQ